MAMKKATKIYSLLAECIDPKPELHFSSAFELLVAVVLSAQCTDKNVNRVTAELWKTLHTPQDYLRLGEAKLAEAIRSIGLYHAKAKHLIALCKMLQEEFGGVVPSTREELMRLPGVGRKTANVVLNCWFQQPVIAVDTHILRVANRLGLSNATTPDGVEQDLMLCTPKKYLLHAHHYLLLHGRYTCRARNPLCETCVLRDHCPYRAALRQGPDSRKL